MADDDRGPPPPQLTSPAWQVFSVSLMVLGVALLTGTFFVRSQAAETQHAIEVTESVASPSPVSSGAAPQQIVVINSDRQAVTDPPTNTMDPPAAVVSPSPTAGSTTQKASGTQPLIAVSRKTTTTTATPSDTVLTALVGLAGILLFLGAFYTRITKFEFASASAQLPGVAGFVDQSVRDVEKKDKYREQPPVKQQEVKAAVARKAVSVWEIAQTKPRREARAALEEEGVTVDDAEVEKLRQGTPSTGFWDQLLDAALGEQELK